MGIIGINLCKIMDFQSKSYEKNLHQEMKKNVFNLVIIFEKFTIMQVFGNLKIQ